MDIWVYLSVGALAVGLLIAVTRCFVLENRLKETRGKVIVTKDTTLHTTDVYLEAYDHPTTWKNDPVVLFDIQYIETK